MTFTETCRKKIDAATSEPCDSCGEPGVIQYDSQGEGRFWLCGNNDENHSEICYSGIVIGVDLSRTALPEAVRRIEKLFDAIKHGDEVHQAWLKKAIEEHFDRPFDGGLG